MEGVKHGATRRYRVETTTTSLGTGVTPSGKEIPIACGEQVSVVEQYCAHCDTWEDVRGVTGALKWMAKHDKGDCVG